MKTTTKTLLGLGVLIGGGYYAKKKGWLDRFLPAQQRSVSAAMTMGPQAESAEQEQEQDSGDNSYDKEEERQEEGSMGGGSSGGGGGGSDGTTSGSASAPGAAPATLPGTLTTGMLLKVPSDTLTPAIQASALQTLVASTLNAQRLAPIATQLAARPTLSSVSMPRPGIVAARAAFPVRTPARAPTRAFQSALTGTAMRAAGSRQVPFAFGTRSQRVTASAPSQTSVFTTARLRTTPSGGSDF